MGERASWEYGIHHSLGMLAGIPASRGVAGVWIDQLTERVHARPSNDPMHIHPVAPHQLDIDSLQDLNRAMSGLGGQGYCIMLAALVGAKDNVVFEFLDDESTRMDLVSRRDLFHVDLRGQNEDPWGATDDLWDLLFLNPSITESDRHRYRERWGLPEPEFWPQVMIFRTSRARHPEWGMSRYLTRCCVVTSLVPEHLTDGEMPEEVEEYLLKPRRVSDDARAGLANGFHEARTITKGVGDYAPAWRLIIDDLDGPMRERCKVAKAALDL